MTRYKKIKLEEIKNFLGNFSIKLSTNIQNDEIFFGINSITRASEKDIIFYNNYKYLLELKDTKAKACLVTKENANLLPESCSAIIVDNPYLSFACLTNLFNVEEKSNGVVSDSTFIQNNVDILKNVQIDSFTTIYHDTKIGSNVIIGPNCCIGPYVEINDNTIIYSNTILSNCTIGNNCKIKSSSVIGGKGFGFEEKNKVQIEHFGDVIIGNNSYIGSNTSIDRAVFDSTIIGNFSHIDNLVQIAHNVTLGKHSIVAAQVGIAGSTVIGDNVKIGGQAGISGHLNIGNNVTIAGKSGVTKNLKDNAIVAGFPAIDIKKWKLNIIKFNRKQLN